MRGRAADRCGRALGFGDQGADRAVDVDGFGLGRFEALDGELHGGDGVGMVGERGVDPIAGRRRSGLPASMGREIVDLLRARDRRHVGVWGWAAGIVSDKHQGAQMALWRFLRGLWRLRQRKIDCETLWPSLVAAAEGDVRLAQNGMPVTA